jgi:uncharacterized protein (TIGR03083 family)
MLGQTEAVALYRASTDRAVVVAEAVRPEQLALPTPCAEWTVQQLIDHLVGGTAYLLAAVAGHQPIAPTGMTGATTGRVSNMSYTR